LACQTEKTLIARPLVEKPFIYDGILPGCEHKVWQRFGPRGPGAGRNHKRPNCQRGSRSTEFRVRQNAKNEEGRNREPAVWVFSWLPGFLIQAFPRSAEGLLVEEFRIPESDRGRLPCAPSGLSACPRLQPAKSLHIAMALIRKVSS